MRGFGIFIIVILVINAVVTDIIIADLWSRSPSILRQAQDSGQASLEQTPTISRQAPTEAPLIATATPTKTETKITIVNKKIRSTTVIPIPGSGSTQENKWINLNGTEFTLDTEDYPNLKEAYLEVNMKLFNGNGTAYVRLFDITAGIEVWGSEVTTSSQSYTSVTSGKITLRPGKHVYRIQAKSLTADTTMYNFGSIKLVSEY